MFRVKICGVKDTETVPALNEALPDFVGFVLSYGFKRSVSEERAKAIRTALDARVKSVGVFVNDDPQKIARMAKEGVISLIQLHGDEDEAYINSLKKICKAPIIKAVRVRDGILPVYPKSCDFVLLDGHAAGGTGKTRIKEYNLNLPVFFAGGVNTDNAEEILKKVKPYCLDCSGGVETDGAKDKEKIKRLVKIVREYR